MSEQPLVSNSTGRLRRVLLCPPTYFRFQPINEITRLVLASGEPEADLAVLAREHAEFAEAYRSRRSRGRPHRPRPRSTLYGLCARLRRLPRGRRTHRQLQRTGAPRRGVALRGQAGRARHAIIGYITRGAFEGGDFWFLDEATVVHGVVARTTWQGVANAQEILEPLGYTVTGVQLASRNLHLDMAFNIVAPGVAVCATAQMPEFFLKMLRKRRFELIDVPSEGVFKHHCNIQALGAAECSHLRGIPKSTSVCRPWDSTSSRQRSRRSSKAAAGHIA